MARNRVIYQSEALYVSKNINSTGSGEHYQLTRVQSANYNFDITRQDVNQFGQLARIDALVLASPTVALDFSYYPTDGSNEKALGFLVTNSGSNVLGNFASGQMGASSGQNFYIVTSDEGTDLNTISTNPTYKLSGKSVIGIGNAYLSNYTFNAAVGQLPTVNVSIEGLNIRSSTVLGTSNAITGNFVPTPAIDPELGSSKNLTGTLLDPIEATGGSYLVALRPGDVRLGFSEYLSVEGSPISRIDGDGIVNIQNASISLPLSRTPIERLGTRFAFARVVDFPITASLNVSAILSEIEARNLSTILDDNLRRTITITINKPDGTGTKALMFFFKGTQLKSESFSSSIGGNKTVDLVFETQIGGPTDPNNGIYVSGTHNGNINGLATWGFA